MNGLDLSKMDHVKQNKLVDYRKPLVFILDMDIGFNWKLTWMSQVARSLCWLGKVAVS